MLDGDTLRTGLNQDLGFSREDRAENVRRTAEVARVLNDAGLVAIVALISPFRAERDNARAIVGAERFVEVHVDTPLEVCEARDVEGALRQGPRRRDPGVHRHQLALRGAAPSRRWCSTPASETAAESAARLLALIETRVAPRPRPDSIAGCA